MNKQKEEKGRRRGRATKIRGGKAAGEQQGPASKCTLSLRPVPRSWPLPCACTQDSEWSLKPPLAGSKESGLGKRQPHRPPSESLTITLNICFAFHEAGSVSPLRYLILLPSRERARQVFSLICALNILVIKQHLRKPIAKSILIGTKISQVVELQLRVVESLALGHRVWRSQKGEGLGRNQISEPGKPGFSL